MLSAQRLNEIVALRWDEIDFERGVIALPASRTKNHRAHEIPLTPAMAALLRAQPKREGRALVFGRGAGGYAGAGHSKQRLDERVKIPAWTHHDLRRTAATGMANIGIQPHVIEAVLNHVSGHKAGVAGVYNRSTYAAEKREALERWGAHVAGVMK